MRMGRRPSAAQSHLSPRPVPHRAGSAHGITNLVGGYVWLNVNVKLDPLGHRYTTHHK